MANEMFDRGRQGFLAGELDWDTDNFRCALVDDTDITFSYSLDEDWADQVAGLIDATAESANFTGTSVTDGIADATDLVIANVAGSVDAADYLTCFLETGNDATQLLIFALDSSTTGLPITTNGGDVTIEWDNTASVLVFKL